MSVRETIDAMIRDAGTQAKLAKRAGCSQNAIYKALRDGRVSAELALKLDRAFDGGKFSASDLRPDLWPTREHVPSRPAARRAPTRMRADAA